MATEATATDSSIPSFPSFSPYITDSPHELTALLGQLYNIAAANPATADQAVQLLTNHIENNKLIIQQEQKLIGRWTLRNLNLSSLDANVDKIGEITLEAIKGLYIKGEITLGINKHNIIGRYKTSQSSKRDESGHLHLILHTKLASNNIIDNSVVQYHQTPDNKEILHPFAAQRAESSSPGAMNEHKVELLLHNTGEAIKGEICPVMEAEAAVRGFGGEEIESSSIYFIGNKIQS
jgi:hypothetical protein